MKEYAVKDYPFDGISLLEMHFVILKESVLLKTTYLMTLLCLKCILLILKESVVKDSIFDDILCLKCIL